MASAEIILVVFVISLGFLWFCRSRSRQPWNWPLLGWVPTLLANFNRLLDKVIEVFELNNGTFIFKNLWFAGLDMLFTCDPENIRHIMSTNFSNYPKGPESQRIFDVLGKLFHNVDDENEWRGQRRSIHAYFNDPRFSPFNQNINKNCLVNGLMPVLEHYNQENSVMDLQDVCQRFMFDTIFMMVTGHDPASLRVGSAKAPFSTSLDDADHAIFLRHILPETCWKLLRFLGLGTEKKLSKAAETLDDVARSYIMMRREELFANGDVHDQRFDLIKCNLTKDVVVGCVEYPDSCLRDWIVNLTFAGRDTSSAVLSWFFWLISESSLVERKIRDEITENIALKQEGTEQNYQLFNVNELSRLVYLHAALCETLRLYPPAPFQRRSPIKPDILPSGHRVEPNMRVIISSYAAGRMKSIWGEDCLEFRPERWLTPKGTLKQEPSYKFSAFSSGPRTCSGRELSFNRMKSVAAAVIHNYNVHVIKDQHIAPANSIIIQMKHGLKVKITKRNT